MCRDVTANGKCMAVFRGTLINLNKFKSNYLLFSKILVTSLVLGARFIWNCWSCRDTPLESQGISWWTVILEILPFLVLFTPVSVLCISDCPLAPTFSHLDLVSSWAHSSKMGQFWERRRIFRAFSQAGGQLLIFRNAGKMKAGAERCHRAGISSSSPGQLQ